METENIGLTDAELDAAWESEEDVSNLNTAPETPPAADAKPEEKPSDAGTAPAGQDQPGETGKAAEPGDAGKAPDAKKPEGQDQLFTLKRMGESREVNRDEVVELAQKGLDYDRISGELDGFKALGRYETLEGYKSFVQELAKDSGTTEESVMDTIRASMVAKREGIDRDAALRKVQTERQEKALAERERRIQEKEDAGKAEKEAAEKAEKARQEDLAAFAKAHPEINAKDIPQAVWDEFFKGTKLADAWARHEAAQLREENRKLSERIAALEQNEKNRERSAGSQQSAGSSTRQEEWERAWYED